MRVLTYASINGIPKYYLKLCFTILYQWINIPDYSNKEMDRF